MTRDDIEQSIAELTCAYLQAQRVSRLTGAELSEMADRIDWLRTQLGSQA